MATPIPAPSPHHQTHNNHASPPQSLQFGSEDPQYIASDDTRHPKGGFRRPMDLYSNTQHMASNGNGNGSVQMPSRGPTSNLPASPSRATHRSTMSMSAFEGSRSPPNPKSTAHVPCKFFRLGQCQAGKACPFSHALDNTGEEICKYFQKVGSHLI